MQAASIRREPGAVCPWGVRSAARFHAIEVEAVIIHSSCIVPERSLKMAGESAPYDEQVFQRIFLQRRVLLQKTIQIVDVCLEMTVMVKVHRLFIDKRLKCIIGVWEGRVDKRIIVVHMGLRKGLSC